MYVYILHIAPKNFACGTHFHFHNYELFEKGHWN